MRQIPGSEIKKILPFTALSTRSRFDSEILTRLEFSLRAPSFPCVSSIILVSRLLILLTHIPGSPNPFTTIIFLLEVGSISYRKFPIILAPFRIRLTSTKPSNIPLRSLSFINSITVPVTTTSAIFSRVSREGSLHFSVAPKVLPPHKNPITML